jgi:hypothetical protein
MPRGIKKTLTRGQKLSIALRKYWANKKAIAKADAVEAIRKAKANNPNFPGEELPIWKVYDNKVVGEELKSMPKTQTVEEELKDTYARLEQSEQRFKSMYATNNKAQQKLQQVTDLAHAMHIVINVMQNIRNND